jgi:taurine--2-oxoglutarate transaminase
VLQCGLTYSGHALACAAGVASVGYYLEHDVCGHVVKVGKVLADYLDRMAQKHPCVGEARHIGLFAALELVKDKEKHVPLVPYGVPNTIMPAIMGELRKRGFHPFGRENNINVCPPLIVTEEELNEHLPMLDEVLSWVDEQYL